MITYSIEGQFPLESNWHTVWFTLEGRTTIEELTRALQRYRTTHPEVQYRLVKHEVIG